MLHKFLTDNRAEIITLCRARVAARPVPLPTQAEIQYGFPLFLDQLAEILRLELSSSPGIRDTAALHGEELLRMGFTVGQVVQDYETSASRSPGLPWNSGRRSRRPSSSPSTDASTTPSPTP